MTWTLWVILAYLVVLMGFNIVRSRRVKTQDDFMVAGRSLSIRVMVFTLICTWIGSGTFIAGAEYAYNAGWSALWLPAGACARHRDHLLPRRQDPDLRPVHDRRHPRDPLRPVRPAVRGRRAHHRVHHHRQLPVPGRRVHPQRGHATGRISVEWGQAIAAVFVIAFTAMAGMMAVAYTDLPNGIIIVSACVAGRSLRRRDRRRLAHAHRCPAAGAFPGVQPGLRRAPRAQGARLLSLHADAAHGRAVHVPEILQRPKRPEGRKTGRRHLDRRHDRGRNDRDRASRSSRRSTTRARVTCRVGRPRAGAASRAPHGARPGRRPAARRPPAPWCSRRA